MQRVLTLIPPQVLETVLNPLILVAAALAATIVFTGLAARILEAIELLTFRIVEVRAQVRSASLTGKQHRETRDIHALDRSGDLRTPSRTDSSSGVAIWLAA